MAKDSSETMPRPIRHMLRRLIKAPAALSILWPAMLLCGGYVSWHQWGAQHVATKFYLIEEQTIQITTQPDYIPVDIVHTVYEDAAIDRISLLDATATAKIAAAFGSHPWVRDVVSVRKLPGGNLDVNLNYRKPAATVYVSQHRGQEMPGYLPIDAEAVALPTDDFSPTLADQYLKIYTAGAVFTGNAGDVFDNKGVIAAAKLASALSAYRKQTGIESISVYGDVRDTLTAQLELTTEDGQRIRWGSAPGEEAPGEATALMKLQALLQGVRPGTDLRYAGRTTATTPY